MRPNANIRDDGTSESPTLPTATAPPQTLCLPTQYFDKSTNACEKLEIYFGAFDSLFSVNIVHADRMDSFARRQLQLDYSKQIVSVSATEIKVQFNFTDPLALSPSDTLEVRLDFGKFEKGLPKN